MKFQIKKEFEPAGDQPKAIKQLVDGVKKGLKHQTLLGVTGSGYTWWQVNYDTGSDGWSVENYLAKSSITSLPPPPLVTTFINNLYYGMQSNSEVLALQKLLTAQGLYSGPLTGNFYNLTLAAVKSFQAKYNILTSGFVGPLTRAKLNVLGQ